MNVSPSLKRWSNWLAVGQEAALQVVELLERRLHLADVFADGERAHHLVLK
jgi:hypothetical protein